MATIYIVEDDINIREIERYALKNSGYEVEEFEGSASFFKRLEKNIPSLILLDIMLPGEDGLDILTRIRADKATADVPVIITASNRFERLTIFPVIVFKKELPVLFDKWFNNRKFIHFEFLIFRRMGIIECPLFERDISADKI